MKVKYGIAFCCASIRCALMCFTDDYQHFVYYLEFQPTVLTVALYAMRLCVAVCNVAAKNCISYY